MPLLDLAVLLLFALVLELLLLPFALVLELLLLLLALLLELLLLLLLVLPPFVDDVLPLLAELASFPPSEAIVA